MNVSSSAAVSPKTSRSSMMEIADDFSMDLWIRRPKACHHSSIISIENTAAGTMDLEVTIDDSDDKTTLWILYDRGRDSIDVSIRHTQQRREQQDIIHIAVTKKGREHRTFLNGRWMDHRSLYNNILVREDGRLHIASTFSPPPIRDIESTFYVNVNV